MSDASVGVERSNGLSVPIRIFGWAILGCLMAFLLSNIINVSTGAGGVLSGNPAIIGIYVLALVCCVLYVTRTRSTSLRHDADMIHRANVYLIRGCFWGVLLIGIVDMSIAFLRTEDLFDYFLGESLITELGRPQFVGTYIHIPLVIAGFVLAAFTKTLGFTWLALLIVAAELLIVLSRFVFSYEQAFMADLVRYWYAALFLFSSAYTLFDDGHVRVDVLYAGLKKKTRGFINAIGTIMLGITTCWVIVVLGFNGKSSIINSPVINFEVTQTGSVGMYVKYQMAAFLGIFAISMMIQFVSYFFETIADYREEPGGREVASVAAH